MTKVAVRTRTKVAVSIGIIAIIAVAAWAISPSLSRWAPARFSPPTSRTIIAEIPAPSRPLWKQKLDAIILPGYATSTSGGNLILRSGRYKAIIGDLAGEDFGKYTLHQLRLCSEKIERLLGVTVFDGTTTAASHASSPTERIGECCGPAPDLAIRNVWAPEDFSRIAFSEDAYWRQPGADFVNACLGGHEEVHRIVLHSSLPFQFNEGLAQYVEEKFKREPGTPASPNLGECLDSGFREIGSDTVIPYRLLDMDDAFRAPRIHAYYTGACFWGRVERTYGADKVQEVIKRTFAMPARGSGDVGAWVRDAVYPVVGRGIRPFLLSILSAPPL